MAASLPPEQIAEKIRTMLRRDLKLGNTVDLSDDMPLVGSNMDLDSLDILLLVTNIEKEFGIKIASQEVGKQVFTSVGTLIGFVTSKCQTAPASATAAPASAPAPRDYLALLPHRDPFRFLSQVVKIEPGVSGEAIWSLTGQEAFFAGHFPGMPLVPGVLLAEALAQLSGIVGAAGSGAATSADSPQQGKLAQVDVRFEASVTPPAQIKLESKLLRMLGGLGQFEVKATLNGVTAAQGTLTIAYAASGK